MKQYCMYENKSALMELAGFSQRDPLAPRHKWKVKMKDFEAIQLILRDVYCLL